MPAPPDSLGDAARSGPMPYHRAQQGVPRLPAADGQIMLIDVNFIDLEDGRCFPDC
jgi:hypothetical protein